MNAMIMQRSAKVNVEKEIVKKKKDKMDVRVQSNTCKMDKAFETVIK
jgi:hypothetical protein